MFAFLYKILRLKNLLISNRLLIVASIIGLYVMGWYISIGLYEDDQEFTVEISADYITSDSNEHKRDNLVEFNGALHHNIDHNNIKKETIFLEERFDGEKSKVEKTEDNKIENKVVTNVTIKDQNIHGDFMASNITISKTSNDKTSKDKTNVEENIMTKSYYRKYTYTDPGSYSGPIIDAWPPNKSRDVSLYMNASFTKLPNKNKLTKKTLLVMVLSSPPEEMQRRVWRNAWGKFANEQTSVLFLIGKSPIKDSSSIENMISKEQGRYGDIVRVQGLIEHYDNLTLKSLYAVKFFLSENIFISEPPKYMLKVDTDTIVNLPKLYHQITEDTKYKNRDHLLMGCCFCCPGKDKSHCKRLKLDNKPFDAEYIKKRKMGRKKYMFVHKQRKAPAEEHPYRRWQIPDYLFNGKQYPSYLSGGSGYVISRSSAECMFKQALRTPYLPLEDVYVTGFVAQSCKIGVLDNPGFSGIRKTKFDPEFDIVTHFDCGQQISKLRCYRDLKYLGKKIAPLLKGENEKYKK